MDSFTTQDSTYYSTAPFNWVTDSRLYDNVEANNLTPGLFLKNDNPLQNNIDKESSLIGLENIVGKCDKVDVNALNKAKQLSNGLQRIYDVSGYKNSSGTQSFLNNTRLTQPEESISEINFNRFIHLPYDPQAVNNIIENDSFGNRGGTWSRNQFKDSYTCPVSDNRGGNHN